MGLLHPLGIFAEHAHRVVDTGQAEFFDAAGSQIAVEVEDAAVGHQFLERKAGVDREGDDVRAVEQVVFAQGLDDLFGCEILALEVRKRLHFEDQARIGLGGYQTQVGVERRNVLAVGEHDRGDLLERRFLHIDVGALVDAVVVDDQLVVGREPYVDFRAENADRIGLRERSQ